MRLKPMSTKPMNLDTNSNRYLASSKPFERNLVKYLIFKIKYINQTY